MTRQSFRLEAVPRIVLDFRASGTDHQKSDDSDEQLVAHDVSLQAAGSAVEVSKTFIPSGLFRMPPEIQAMIWAERMQKPGLHFLAVQVPLTGGPGNDNGQGSRMIKLTEPCHKVLEISEPYRSYFPKGIRSAYHDWAELSSSFPYARRAMELALVEPLTIAPHNNLSITIDAATDLLYLKFLWRPKRGHQPQYVPSPGYWMLILDHSHLNGIRHVAFEMNPVEFCIYWPSDNTSMTCAQCGSAKADHDDDVSSELWLLADFLHCLQDLETVYLVFNDIKQGPFDARLDARYTVSGNPTVTAGATDQTRWDTSPDPVFRGAGGSVRELRGSHVVLPVAHVVDTLQAYYMYHNRTSIGEVEAISQRTKEERKLVKFKLATCTLDE